MVSSPPSSTDRRLLWSFWIACALAVIAGVSPFIFGGGSSRLNGAVFPFALAAVAFGACALLHSQGRPITTALYFLSSLAAVYGILAMIAVPLRLAVLGTCSPDPAPCAPGLERPLTAGESTALGFAIGIAIVAILTGFFGLVTLYRRQAAASLPPIPPVRQIAPVGTKKPPETTAAAPAAEPIGVATPAPEPEPEPELPAHTPDLELAAPVEPLELPEVGTADRVEVAPPAQPKPRRKRVPKATPAPPPPTPDTDASA